MSKVTIQLVEANKEKSLYINNYRVAGPKPWGGGFVTTKWTCESSEILEALSKKEED